MKDARIEKLADILLNYSIKLKKKQTVIIMGTPLAESLIKELYKQALQLGAHPMTRVAIEGLEEIHYRHASDDQLKYMSPMRRYEMEKTDAIISILSSYNTKSLSNIDPAKQALTQKASAPLFKKFLARAAQGKVSWVGCLYPTFAQAQDAGMSLGDYEKFLFEAYMLDRKNPVEEWRKVSRYNARLIKYLSQKDTIRIVAPDTDLTCRAGGRKWVNCDGANNFPDGEVFTGPIEDSAEGHIRFTFPAVFGGREVDDVRIEFKNGKAVKATAARGEAFLNAMLDTDKGARFLGEVAIGTNFGIKDFTRNTALDEKIGGTIHMALGQAYPETGSKNVSGLHWDMVCDLRKGGALYADGELFFKNGKFLK